MSKKTLNKIFTEKINRERIRENVLKKANKHSVDYVRYIKVGVLIGCLILVVILCIDDKKNSNVGNSFIKVESTENILDTNELINDSQYAFIGMVSNHRDENDYYPVKVYENIKGELVKDKDIKIKVDNFDLDVTSIYLFTAKIVNHELIILRKENANLLIDIDTNNSSDNNNYSIALSKQDTKTIKEIADKYRVTTDSYSDGTTSFNTSLEENKELSKYDVNYKE